VLKKEAVARVIPPGQHSIAPGFIGRHALTVLDQLHAAGFDGLLVGGCVRDLMLGREPKDFDVVTDASPEQIRGVFRRARLVGRRFRLAHVRVGREVVEVATFRAAPDAEATEESSASGRLLSDNVFGTRADDAVRRDFTINALYYDNRDGTVIDYVGGVEDLQRGVLRTIGDPERRYREDPVRMLRAIRFAAKLGFRIDPPAEDPIARLASMLDEVPPARLFEEVLKLFQGGHGVAAYELLRHYRLFERLFPLTEDVLEQERGGFPLTLVLRALENTDRRIAEDKPVTPAFLFAALLWEPVRVRITAKVAAGLAPVGAILEAADEVLAEQLQRVALPRRFSVPMREIWSLQPRFDNRSGKRPARLLGHKRFRAAYDFLLLRAEAGEADPALAQWWTDFQSAGDSERPQLLESTAESPSPKRRRRRRGGRRRRRTE